MGFMGKFSKLWVLYGFYGSGGGPGMSKNFYVWFLSVSGIFRYSYMGICNFLA